MTPLSGLIGSRRLAARAAAGDERAFAAIFERHHQELYRYCLAILRRPARRRGRAAGDDVEGAAVAAGRGAARSSCGRGSSASPTTSRSRSCAAGATRPSELPEESPGGSRAGGAGREQRAAADARRRPAKRCPTGSAAPCVMRELSGPLLRGDRRRARLRRGRGAADGLRGADRAADARGGPARWTVSRSAARSPTATGAGCAGASCAPTWAPARAAADFEAAIGARREDLAALCPPLPLAAAGGILGGLLGHGSGAGGAARPARRRRAPEPATVAGGFGGAAAVKGASIVAAVAIAAGGGAAATGVIDLPDPLHHDSAPASSSTAPPSSSTERSAASPRRQRAAPARQRDRARAMRAAPTAARVRRAPRASRHGHDHAHGGRERRSQANGGGNGHAKPGRQLRAPRRRSRTAPTGRPGRRRTPTPADRARARAYPAAAASTRPGSDRQRRQLGAARPGTPGRRAIRRARNGQELVLERVGLLGHLDGERARQLGERTRAAKDAPASSNAGGKKSSK